MRLVIGVLLIGNLFALAEGEEKDPTFGVRDPCVVAADGRYYIFSTGTDLPILVSEDLRTFERLGTAFPGLPDWAAKSVPDAPGFWAPHVRRIGDLWHLYYSVSTVGSNHSAIGVAVSPTLDPDAEGYGWKDRGVVLESRPGRDHFNAIDPHVAFDRQGRPWLFWGSFWTGIKAAALDPATGKLAEPFRPVDIARRPHPGAIEAPYIVNRGDAYYLFVSFDFTLRGVNSDYKVMVGRSKELLGPYVDRNDRRMMDGGGTLVTAGHGRWRGPGHNSVVETFAESYLAHHVNDAEHGGADRLQVRPLLWLEDGWPVAADPESMGVWNGARARSPVGTWLHSADYHPETTLKILPGGALVEQGSDHSWTVEGGRTLTMRWPRGDAPGGTWIDRCLLSVDGVWYVGRNQIGSVIRGRRER